MLIRVSLLTLASLLFSGNISATGITIYGSSRLNKNIRFTMIAHLEEQLNKSLLYRPFSNPIPLFFPGRVKRRTAPIQSGQNLYNLRYS